MPAKLSLRKNIAWNSSGSFVYLFFQWLVTYLVVLLLGFEDAGIFSLAIAIGSVAFAFALYGVRGYQVSDIKRKFSDRSYIVARLITCVLAILGVIVYVIVSGYSTYVALCIIAFLLFKMSEAYVDVYHGVIQRSMRMDYIGKSLILRGVITNTLFIITAILTKNLLLAISVQAISSFALIYIYDRRKVRQFYEKNQNSNSNNVLPLLIECLPLSIYIFLSNLLMSIPRVSLEDIRGSEILGIYASVAIPAAIVQVFAGFIFSPVLTIFAQHVDEKNFKSFYKLLFRVLGYIGVFSVAMIIGGAVFGDFGLKLLFGEKIAPYTYLFVPILIISSLTAVSWFIGLMLTVIREFKGLIIASSTAAAVSLIGSSFFIDWYGLNGVNYVLLISLTLHIAVMTLFMVIKISKIRHKD